MNTRYQAPPPRGLAEMVAHLRTQMPDDALHAHHKAIIARLGQLADAVAGLDRIAASPDPAVPKAAHALRVKTAAKSLEAKANAINEMIAGSVQSGTVDLSAAIDNFAGLRADEYATEIRHALRALSQKERDEQLRNAVDAGHASVVAAMTSAPACVVGFSGDLQERMRDAYRKKHAPLQYEALTRLHDLFSSSSVVVDHARKAASQVVDEKYLSQILRDQEAAKEASEAFNSSLAD